MNFAFALAVAGLAFSAARVFVTSPGGQTAIWMLLRLQDAAQVGLVRCARAQPLDRRFLVAEGLKEGERKLPASNGCSASAEIASSISTAFNALP